MPNRKPKRQIVFERWVAQLRTQGHTVAILRPPEQRRYVGGFWCLLDVSGTIASYDWDNTAKEWCLTKETFMKKRIGRPPK